MTVTTSWEQQALESICTSPLANKMFIAKQLNKARYNQYIGKIWPYKYMSANEYKKLKESEHKIRYNSSSSGKTLLHIDTNNIVISMLTSTIHLRTPEEVSAKKEYILNLIKKLGTEPPIYTTNNYIVCQNTGSIVYSEDAALETFLTNIISRMEDYPNEFAYYIETRTSFGGDSVDRLVKYLNLLIEPENEKEKVFTDKKNTLVGLNIGLEIEYNQVFWPENTIKKAKELKIPEIIVGFDNDSVSYKKEDYLNRISSGGRCSELRIRLNHIHQLPVLKTLLEEFTENGITRNSSCGTHLHVDYAFLKETREPMRAKRELLRISHAKDNTIKTALNKIFLSGFSDPLGELLGDGNAMKDEFTTVEWRMLSNSQHYSDLIKQILCCIHLNLCIHKQTQPNIKYLQLLSEINA